MNKQSKASRWIIPAVILALLLRLGLLLLAVFEPSRMLEEDSLSYLVPAQFLLDDGYYSYPSGMRVPVYPAFIAIIQSIFGPALLPVVIAQVLLGLGTVYLTYRLGLLLELSRSASILAALLLSFSLESLFSPLFILSDTLFAFLLISASCTLLKFIRTARPVWLVSTSLLAGLITLCRPIAIGFGLIILVILLFFNRKASIMKRIVHSAVYLLLLGLLFILPWSWRNAQVVGVGSLTTESDLYLLWGAASVNADINGTTVDHEKVVLDEVVERLLAERILPPSEANLYAIRYEISTAIILDHPGKFLLLTLRYDLRSFLPGMGYSVKYLGLSQGNTEGLELLQSEGIQRIFANYFSGRAAVSLIFLPFIALLACIYLGALVGVGNLFKHRQWLALAVLLLPVAYLFGVTGYSANSRYRVPLAPYLALLAGLGLPLLGAWLRRTPWKEWLRKK